MISQYLYYKSPAWFQNLLISTYGRKLYTQRYSGIYKQILQEIEAVNHYSKDEIHNLQSARLQKMINYCANQIPYYKKLFSEHGIDHTTIKHPEDLVKIPILEKSTLRDSPELLQPSKPNKYITQNTSGSTGTPLSIYVNEYCYKMAMALVVEHEQSHGVKFKEPRATFAGRMIKEIGDNTPPFSRFNKAENQSIFSSYHINKDNFPYYDKELTKLQPKELIGYPSAIYAIASQYQAHNIKPDFQPKLIVTNSETLTLWQREVIESVFNCKIYDYYGTAEYLIFANQCQHNNYHISPLLGILETVDKDNHSVTGSVGDVICTTLSNYSMPLLRYRVGDRAAISNESCPCGKASKHLSSVEGRIDDCIITQDNKRIGRIDHIFKGLHGIKEAQVIQNQLTECSIKIVPTTTPEQVDTKLLIKNMHERTGINMTVTIDFVQSISRGANGKFKSVISNIGK